MLTITVPASEFFDEKANEFINYEEFTLELEHSLVSLSKWESVTNKPFLGKDAKTSEELLFYVECMSLTENFPGGIFGRMSRDNLDKISEYIDSTQTATWFNDRTKPSRSTEIITAELVYYWMVQLQIPFECQYWHLNRLFTLIRICNIKSQKPKKMSRNEMLAQRHALNQQRQQQYGTSG